MCVMGNRHGSLCSNVETRSQRTLQTAENPTKKTDVTSLATGIDEKETSCSGEQTKEEILQTDMNPLSTQEETLRIPDDNKSSALPAGEPTKFENVYELMGTSCCLDYSMDEHANPGSNQHACDPDEKQSVRGSSRNGCHVNTDDANDYLDYSSGSSSSSSSNNKISHVDSTLSGLLLLNCLKLADDEKRDEEDSRRSVEIDISQHTQPSIEDSLAIQLDVSSLQEKPDESGGILRGQLSLVKEGHDVQLRNMLDTSILSELLIEGKRSYSARLESHNSPNYSVLSDNDRPTSLNEPVNCPGASTKLHSPSRGPDHSPPVKIQTVRLPGVSENRTASQLSLTVKPASGSQVSVSVKNDVREIDTNGKNSHISDGEEPLPEVFPSQATCEFVAGAGDDKAINFPERVFVKEKAAVVVKEKKDCETSMIAFVDECLGQVEHMCLHLVDSTDSESQVVINSTERPPDARLFESGNAPSTVNPLKDTNFSKVTRMLKKNPLTHPDSIECCNKKHQRSVSLATLGIPVAQPFNTEGESRNANQIHELLGQLSGSFFDTEEQLPVNGSQEQCDESSLNTSGSPNFGNHLSSIVDELRADVVSGLEDACRQDSDNQEPENVDIACEGVLTTPSLEDPCLLLYKLPLQAILTGDKQMLDPGDATNDDDVTMCSLSNKIKKTGDQMGLSEVEACEFGTTKIIRAMEDKECFFEKVLLQKVSSLVMGSAGHSENVVMGVSNVFQVLQSADDFDAFVDEADSKPMNAQGNSGSGEADIVSKRDLLSSHHNGQCMVAEQINGSNSFPGDLDELLFGLGNECNSNEFSCSERSVPSSLISSVEKYTINGL